MLILETQLKSLKCIFPIGAYEITNSNNTFRQYLSTRTLNEERNRNKIRIKRDKG